MFDIRLENDNIIYLSGRFDASQVDKAREFLNKIDQSCQIDFADLDYISSVGIGVLLGVSQRLSKENKSVKLINMSENIKNIFYYAGLTRLFEFD